VAYNPRINLNALAIAFGKDPFVCKVLVVSFKFCVLKSASGYTQSVRSLLGYVGGTADENKKSVNVASRFCYCKSKGNCFYSLWRSVVVLGFTYLLTFVNAQSRFDWA
jgi:hypothetical protein